MGVQREDNFPHPHRPTVQSGAAFNELRSTCYPKNALLGEFARPSQEISIGEFASLDWLRPHWGDSQAGALPSNLSHLFIVRAMGVVLMFGSVCPFLTARTFLDDSITLLSFDL